MTSLPYIIIVAGGTGSRMQSSIPKQFLNLKGRPILVHTIEKFLTFHKQIQVIVCVHKDYLKEANGMLTTYFPGNSFQVVEGGETRFHSVKNGLALIKDLPGIVGIHDAARPFVTIDTIKRCYETADQKGNAIPVVSLHESLRMLSHGINKAVNRDDYKIVQTPQCFQITTVKEAFQQPYSNVFTDDATVLEQQGHSIYMVEGNKENIKITTPEDLKLAELYL